jgi:hypothetical protein
MFTPPEQAQAALEELRSALARLDLRVRLSVNGKRAELAEHMRDPFHGLYISDKDVDELLASVPGVEAAKRALLTPVAATVRRLARLAGMFDLSSFDQEVVLVCLAPEVDLRYERLYAYLQDDANRKHPTVDLVLRLLDLTPEAHVAAREALGAGGSLQRHGLLTPTDDIAAQSPLLARPLSLDERIVEYLLGSDQPDPRIATFSKLYHAAQAPPPAAVLGTSEVRLVELLGDRSAAPRYGPVVYMNGSVGTSKRATVRAMCQVAGRRLLLVDLAALSLTSRPVQAIGWVTREALLQDAVLGLDSVESLWQERAETLACRAELHSALMRRPGTTLVLGETHWEPALWLPEVPSIQVKLRSLGQTARERVWHDHVNGSVHAEDVAELAMRYRLDDEGVRAVAAAAHGRAFWRGVAQIGSDDLRDAARRIAAPPMEGLATPIEPRYGRNDIVLSQDGAAQLHELCDRARHQVTVLEHWGYGHKHARRSGLIALFAGPPGTGKTMAAEVVAGDLGLELYRIDLSAIVSKYIGETEKNLEKVFRAADQGDAVLLFDEADALFGKRSEVRDAHDRYANVEVAYLLQRLEAYEGVAILTTNLRGNIDEAFLRRLDCVLEFPIPGEADRLQIWRRALPPEAPVGDEVDLLFLARKFKLSGGHIRNIALTAGYLAAVDGGPIRMKHLVRGTRREYQKLGKLVGETDFEDYFDLLRDTDIERRGVMT